jgi:hypothetical protein
MIEGSGRQADCEIQPDLAFRQVRVATVDGGETGVLVIKSDQLVAVLTRVEGELYSGKEQWFLETGFGRLSGRHELFHSLEEAKNWIETRYSSTELAYA